MGGNLASILICSGWILNAVLFSAFLSYFYAYRVDLLNTKFEGIYRRRNINSFPSAKKKILGHQSKNNVPKKLHYACYLPRYGRARVIDSN